MIFKSEEFWDNCLYLLSIDTSQKYLLAKYEKLIIDNPVKKSLENSDTLVYYLEQGKSFLIQSEQSPINIKPILQFYGLVYLLKACLLTVDPNYPESTVVLAHGASTRKRKKQNYQYFKDEVKIQKNGLFPHFSDKMFHMKHLEGEKITLKELFLQIPELYSYYQKWDRIEPAFKIVKENNQFIINEQVLDLFKMTKPRFITYLTEKTNIQILFNEDSDSITFTLPEENLNRGIEILPFRYSILTGHYYLPKKICSITFFYELMIHYLILYHLSMIARYEVEWWYELIHYKSTIEYPLILRYLELCPHKTTFLINQFLFFDSDHN